MLSQYGILPVVTRYARPRPMGPDHWLANRCEPRRRASKPDASTRTRLSASVLAPAMFLCLLISVFYDLATAGPINCGFPAGAELTRRAAHRGRNGLPRCAISTFLPRRRMRTARAAAAFRRRAARKIIYLAAGCSSIWATGGTATELAMVRDRKFQSISPHQRVSREPDFLDHVGYAGFVHQGGGDQEGLGKLRLQVLGVSLSDALSCRRRRSFGRFRSARFEAASAARKMCLGRPRIRRRRKSTNCPGIRF